MKNHSIRIAVMLLAVSFSIVTINAQYPAQVKIMTYNIQAENAKHTGGDYSDIATVINAIKPNILGMQKVDSFHLASMDVLKYLGEQAGMKYTFSMSYKEGNGSYGNGFLSDSVPISSRRLAIPKGSASEDRSALEIGITMGGERVRVIVTHLAYDGETYRTTQLQQILPWIDAGGTTADPVVIMADFNAGETAASMKVLTDAGFAYVKGKNGVVLDSTQKINHILYRPAARWKINDAGNPKYTASNRNPLWADMELLDPVTAVRPAVSRLPLSLLNYSNGTFHFSLHESATVSLRVIGLTGKSIRTIVNGSRLDPAAYSFPSGPALLPPGVYYGMLSVDGRNVTVPFSVIR